MITTIDSHAAWRTDAESDATGDEGGGVLSVTTTAIAAVPVSLLSLLLFSAHPSVILTLSAISLAVVATWLARRVTASFQSRIPPESESLMNFSRLGVLTCICDNSIPKVSHRAERRQSCRACGHAIVPKNPVRLDEAIGARQIARMEAKLRTTALRAKGMDLPSSIENVDELIEYLRTAKPNPPQDPPRHAPSNQFA